MSMRDKLIIKKAFIAMVMAVIMLMQIGVYQADAAEFSDEEIAAEDGIYGDETEASESDIMLINIDGTDKAVDDEAFDATIGKIEELIATGLNKNTIRVTWIAADDATNYKVYYKAAPANEYVLIQALDAIEQQEEYSAEITLTHRKNYNIKVIPINKTREEIIEGEAKEITYDNSAIVSPDHQ